MESKRICEQKRRMEASTRSAQSPGIIRAFGELAHHSAQSNTVSLPAQGGELSINQERRLDIDRWRQQIEEIRQHNMYR